MMNEKMTRNNRKYMALDFLCAAGLAAVSVFSFIGGWSMLGFTMAGIGFACFVSGIRTYSRSNMCRSFVNRMNRNLYEMA